MAETIRDYVEWHRGYDYPASALSRRLAVVRRRLGQALDAIPGEACRVLSLCAGDGRDILDVAATFAAGGARAPSIALVELNPELASAAVERARAQGLDTVVVIQGDAGDTGTWKDRVPVDLLVLCGIFGNISPADIERTIDCVPAMVREGGYVVWTRGGGEHSDLRPQVRRWFSDAGLPELAFDGAAERYGVGLNVRSPGAGERRLPPRLFTFHR
jgi:SAM-dependent methyltransferase